MVRVYPNIKSDVIQRMINIKNDLFFRISNSNVIYAL